LEYDDERSGDFSPLRFVPENKTVVVGVVTSKKGELEEKDYVIGRVKEAAKYMSLENMCLSPQCGFSSTVHGTELTEAQQWAKLEFIVNTAREIWGD
jgi:5-methyltetrahydropteroyltriglutamate--homocysteine methyltransferase